MDNRSVEQPAQAGRENKYGLAEGQVWEYLPSANLGCERRVIAMTEDGLRPTDNGMNTCDDLEWFVAHARLISTLSPSTPAPARERRAGQRWSFDYDGRHPGSIYTLTTVRNGAWWATDKNGRESCFASDREFAEQPHMYRFVPDAPATSEPGRASAAEMARRAVRAEERIAALSTPKGTRSTQEAAKAEPIEFWQCDKCASDDDTKPTIFDGRTRMYCKPCRMGLETWISAQSGESPRALPTRLSRPRLTHSATWADWAEDC